MKVFVAGATGAIGRPLIAELIRQGHTVTGMTRSDSGTQGLKELGAVALIAINPFPQAVETPRFLHAAVLAERCGSGRPTAGFRYRKRGLRLSNSATGEFPRTCGIYLPCVGACVREQETRPRPSPAQPMCERAEPRAPSAHTGEFVTYLGCQAGR